MADIYVVFRNESAVKAGDFCVAPANRIAIKIDAAKHDESRSSSRFPSATEKPVADPMANDKPVRGHNLRL